MFKLNRAFILAALGLVFLGSAGCGAHAARFGYNGFLRPQPNPYMQPVSGVESVGEFGGREYRFFQPEAARSVRTPLVIVLHGGLGTADGVETALNMNGEAEKHGFSVAYLNGFHRSWNAGGCCGHARRDNVDDVGYIYNFIQYMTDKFPVDSNRIYLVGHSNGSMMSYRFVCTEPGMVKAMVTISGPLMIDGCAHQPDLRVLHIHSQDDQHVPVQGGRGQKSMTQKSVFSSLQYTQDELRGASATFNLRLLPGEGHHLKDIKPAWQAKEGEPLAVSIMNFLDRNIVPR